MGFILKDSFFTQYALPLMSQIKNSEYFAFKDHPRFPFLADILSRKHRHHALLHLSLTEDAIPYFLGAFLAYLDHEHAPHLFRHIEPLYLAIEQLGLNDAKRSTMENDIQEMLKILNQETRHLLLILNDANFLNPHYQGSFLTRQLFTLINHERCRCIVLNRQTQAPQALNPLNVALNEDFTQITIAEETPADAMTILMQERMHLEQFHHVIIPEDLLDHAYALADRYLGDHNTLEKALLLLDSSAARAQRVELNEVTQFKPVLTAATLNQTLSNWIDIPPALLQPNRFKLNDFINSMQHRVFGQETAITLLGHELQQAQANLRLHSSTFCNLLFAGPKNTGKTTLAVALAEQLFMQTNMLYIAQSSSGPLSELKVQSYAHKTYHPLKEVILSKPYAIILIEDVEQLQQIQLEELQELLGSGYMHDKDGQTFNFKHSIFILTTTLGTKKLLDMAKAQVIEEETQDMDLVQLIMNNQKQPGLNTHRYSPQDVADEIMPEIATYIPAGLCQHLHVIPFLPLDKTAIDNIIRLNLRDLGKLLETRHGVELSYAPEVLRFLTFCVTRKDSHQPLRRTLKMVYFTVEQALLNQAENKNRPNQLLLQLNEMGQMLRADWVGPSMRQQA